ncbi:hypothetical protein GCM10009839_55320 [Catenulispora yoronensis]|uniref:Uncharacterized protein n=1 Tax=Catenulispora yoronensis TaxID=450799 RepID=A0ABN2UVL6_9ACTN
MVDLAEEPPYGAPMATFLLDDAPNLGMLITGDYLAVMGHPRAYRTACTPPQDPAAGRRNSRQGSGGG